MAVFNRVNGDSQNVQNVGGDVTRNANSKIISTGVAGPLNVYNIEVVGNLAAELGGPNGSGVPGAVETLYNGLNKIIKLSSNKKCVLLDCDTFYTQDILSIVRNNPNNLVFYWTLK